MADNTDDQTPINDYPLELQPLKHSHEYDCIEQELKGLFIGLFEETLRAKERDLNVYGMPHLGSFELISRFVKEDGLALVNNDDEHAMRYLYKAWAGRNPRRGLHFLKTYLQLLWPNRSAAYQLWYRKDKQVHYPIPLHEKIPYDPAVEISEDDYFLTCRVLALVEFDNDPVVRGVIEPALRAALAAEFVLELRSLLIADSGLLPVAGAGFATVWAFEAEIIDPMETEASHLMPVSASSYGQVFGAEMVINDPPVILPAEVAVTPAFAVGGNVFSFDCELVH